MAQETKSLNPFDAWLWNLDDDALASLEAEELARRATGDGVPLPQLTFLTVIGSGVDSAVGPLKRTAPVALAGSRDLAGRGLLWNRMGDRNYILMVLPAGPPGVHHLVASVPVTDGRWRRVEETWLRSTAPRLASVILNDADFKAIADALADHGSVSVSRMTARVLRDESSYTRGWKGLMSHRPSPRQALAEAEGMLVRTLTASVGSRLAIHLRRQAGATFYRGDYDLFCGVVLQRLTKAAADRRELLSDRARHRDEPIRDSIVMKLPQGTFNAQAASSSLLESVGTIRSVQVAVFHRNPYLHFTVTDYLDGSNYDVFVTDNDALTLLPGYNASAGSLARVTDAMGEALGMLELQTGHVADTIPDRDFFGVA